MSFNHCDLREANFSHSNIIWVTFKDSFLYGANFDHATIENVDLRGTKFWNLSCEGLIIEQVKIPEDKNSWLTLMYLYYKGLKINQVVH